MTVDRGIVLAAAGKQRLESDPIDPGSVLSGDPAASACDLARWDDGTVSGVWRCEPGCFRDVESDETFVVLAGRATIEHDGGLYEIGAGDVCVLPEGARTVWTIHETLLKVFVIRDG